jgi:hypothetical protein
MGGNVAYKDRACGGLTERTPSFGASLHCFTWLFRALSAVGKTMKRFLWILAVLLLVFLGGVAAMLAADIPPRRTQVEHVIPNDRFFGK